MPVLYLIDREKSLQARAGDTEGALDQLEKLMEIGWSMNPWFLVLNPEWDLLRGNPRFEALAAPPEWGVTDPH